MAAYREEALLGIKKVNMSVFGTSVLASFSARVSLKFFLLSAEGVFLKLIFIRL